MPPIDFLETFPDEPTVSSRTLKDIYYPGDTGALSTTMGEDTYCFLIVTEDFREKIVSFFRRWLNEKAKTVGINRTQIQSDDSTVCGLYCVMFLRKVLIGDRMEDFQYRITGLSRVYDKGQRSNVYILM